MFHTAFELKYCKTDLEVPINEDNHHVVKVDAKKVCTMNYRVLYIAVQYTVL